jgi:hypothetical protein
MENEGFFPNLDETPKKRKGKSWSTGTTKRGLGARPLLETEIKEAQSKSRSAFETARTLGVSYNTYKKYAKLYDIFDVNYNPANIPIERRLNLNVGKYPLADILQGMYPHYPIIKLKKRLLKNGVFPTQCTCCGFDEIRVTDGKSPLLLDFLDGDWTNHRIENLRFLCYNCFFLLIGKRKIPKNGQFVEQGITGDEDDNEVEDIEIEEDEI